MYIRCIAKQYHSCCCEFSENIRKAFYEIDNYKEKRLDIDDDLFQYWRNKKFVFPSLRKLNFAFRTSNAS